MHPKLPRITKLVFIVTAFMITVAIMLIFTLYFVSDNLDLSKLFQAEVSIPASNDPVFYKSIGQTPEELKEQNDSLGNQGEQYAIEFKVVHNQQEAEKLVEMLTNMNIQAYYTPINQNGRVIFKIRSGFYKSKDLAINAAKYLQEKKNIAAKIVQF